MQDLVRKCEYIRKVSKVLKFVNSGAWRHLLCPDEIPGVAYGETDRCTLFEILTCSCVDPLTDEETLSCHWDISAEANACKNLPLVLDSLEKKFDRGEVCFLPMCAHGSLVVALRILNQSIASEIIEDTRQTFKELEGSCVHLGYNSPSYKCIHQHRYYAILAAKKKGWIDSQEYSSLAAQFEFWSPMNSNKISHLTDWIRALSLPVAQGSSPIPQSQHLNRTDGCNNDFLLLLQNMLFHRI